MVAIITVQNTALHAIESHIENSKLPSFTEDYIHRWNFDNYASDLALDTRIQNWHKLPTKPVTVYNYGGFGLEINARGKVRGSRKVRSQLSAFNYITVAHQFIMIQSVITGRFIGINEQNRVVSLKTPSANTFWFEHVKTESHRNFHTLTNRQINHNGNLCNLAMTRKGRVVCRSSIRKKSTSFLPVRRRMT